MRVPDADPKVASQFPAFMIRRLLSYHMDAILEVNEMNSLGLLDNQLQYEYLLHALPKRNRYSQTHKVQTPENLDLIKRYYGYSDIKAVEVLDLHTTEDFAMMSKYLSVGGIIEKNKT